MSGDQLILAAWTCDEHIDPRAEFAILDLTPDLARGLLALMDGAAKLKVDPLFDGLYCISLWAGGPIFLAWSSEITDDGARAKEDFAPPILCSTPYDEADIIRMDCVTMRVQPDEIDWTGYIKHTSAVVDTAGITRDFLVDYLKGKEG